VAANVAPSVPVGVVSRAKTAYDGIRGAILNGDIELGNAITETELARRLEMSRTPVREALVRLELEGYFQRGLDGRLVAYRPSATEIEETFFVRTIVEVAAFKSAVERISQAEVVTLEDLVERDAAAVRGRRLREAADLNSRIHELVVDAARNPLLARLVRRLATSSDGFAVFAVGSHADQQRFLGDHIRFVELIRDGDALRLGALLTDHLARARDLLLGTLTEGRV
jgi:DNA-binding GntR family transcriptional regulator